MPYTQLNNLDYLEIKENLKTYMRSRSEFTDYDFEGSALSHILDVLAYNTYYTAFNTNLIANEFFIDSATLRDNVVRIAKQLGYKPKSRVAPKATSFAFFRTNSPAAIRAKNSVSLGSAPGQPPSIKPTP